MSAGRRGQTVFRLTALLDLLLIVLFANMIEVQRLSEERVAEAKHAETGARELRAALEETNRKLREELEAARGEQQDLAVQLEEERNRDATLAESQLQREAVYAGLLEQVLPAGSAQVQEALQEALARIESGLAREEVEQYLKQKLQDGGEVRLDELVNDLMKFQAVRRITSLWEIHLNADDAYEFFVEEEPVGGPFFAQAPDGLQAEILRRLEAVKAPQDVVVISVYRDIRSTSEAYKRLDEALQGLRQNLQDRYAAHSRTFLTVPPTWKGNAE